MALMLALQSPEFEILGVTTVAGNDSLERATSDVLRILEILGKPLSRSTRVPTCRWYMRKLNTPCVNTETGIRTMRHPFRPADLQK